MPYQANMWGRTKRQLWNAPQWSRETMADFDKAVEVLLAHEGGFASSDNHNGAVNCGITSRFLSQVGLPNTEADVRALTKAAATALYRRYFWDPLNLGHVVDQQLATLIFSMAVNCGAFTAVRLLQLALFELGYPIKIDGALGPKTAGALNSASSHDTIQAYKRRLTGRYQHLADAKPELYADDLGGWLNRLDALTT